MNPTTPPEAPTDALVPVSRTECWKHQLVGYRMIVQQRAAMLAFDMGTGKTKCVVDAVANLKWVKTVLIICPTSVIAVWPGEFAKHSGTKLNITSLREGTTAARARQMNHQLDVARAMNLKAVIVVNYEAIWRGDLAKLAMSRLWDMLVCDEIHRIKSPGGKASRFIARLGRNAKRRVGLTGTPMPHSPLDLYGQYRFLDDTIYGRSFVRFRARYAVMGGYENHQVLGFQNQEELHQKFYSIAHRVKKSDVLDLPPTIHETRYFELGPKAKKVYYELENEFISDVGQGIVTAANALARLLRLQQITSGFVGTEDGELVDVGTGKQKMLGDFLEDLPILEPVVVFCRFRRDLEHVAIEADAKKRRCLELSGRINQLADWQQATEGEILAVQIQAGGVGVDLTRAAYCAYYSLGFSLGDYEQSLARLDRPGQTRSVTYLHLVARGTIDTKVYGALRQKKNVIESILSLIRKGQEHGNRNENAIEEVRPADGTQAGSGDAA